METRGRVRGSGFERHSFGQITSLFRALHDALAWAVSAAANNSSRKLRTRGFNRFRVYLNPKEPPFLGFLNMISLYIIVLEKVGC